MPVTGGQRLDLEVPTEVTGIRWASDDTITFGSLSGPVAQVTVSTGAVTPLTTVNASAGELGHTTPEPLPGMRGILFTVWSGSPETAQIAVQAIGSPERHALIPGSSPRYAPSGHLIFAGSDGDLWAVPFNVDALDLQGDPVRLLALSGASFDIARDGSMVYGTSRRDQGRLVWVDRNGTATPILDEVGFYTYPDLSPDGRRVAVSVATGQFSPDAPTLADIWVYDTVRSSRIRLTDDRVSVASVWSADGERVAFARMFPEAFSTTLLWTRSDGSGEPEVLRGGEGMSFPVSWLPERDLLTFIRADRPGEWDIHALDVTGGQSLDILVSRFSTGNHDLSPDGQWLAYMSNETGRQEVYVGPFSSPDAKIPVSTQGGNQPRWSPVGNEIFYRSLDGRRMMVVPIETEPTLSVGIPEVLFEGDFEVGFLGGTNFDVSPDGKRFVMVEPVDDAQSSGEFHFVENWLSELERLIPVN